MARAHLAGDDARHHIGLDRRIADAALEAEPDADPNEREGDEEPDAQEGEHGAERDSTRGVLAPDEEVEQEEQEEDNAWRQRGLVARENNTKYGSDEEWHAKGNSGMERSRAG